MRSLRTLCLLALLALTAACRIDIPRFTAGDAGDNVDAGDSVDGRPDSASAPDATVDATPAVCGNSVMDPGEACDTGTAHTATCDSDCTVPACADGVFNPAAEQCDDGNTTDDGNGCDNVCRKNSVCGDNIVQSFFEACDDGDQSGGDGCSADCQQAVVELRPVSDRGGTDSNNDGIYDYMNDETSTGDAISWIAARGESRIAFELNTSLLHSTYLVESANFGFVTSGLSGQATVQLHGYLGNGAVELADMTQDRLVTSFLAADVTPRSLDVKALLQAAADEEWPFTGLMLRLATPPASLFNLGVRMSNNSDTTQRPRLNLVFCVDADRNAACD